MIKEDQIKEKIKESQQHRVLQFEILGLVVFLSLLINIFSSIIYDQYRSHISSTFGLIAILMLIIGTTILFFNQFQNPQSNQTIFTQGYSILSARYGEATIYREICKKFLELGLTSEEFTRISKQYEQALRKIISHERFNVISNHGIQNVIEKENETKIILDISRDGVKASTNIHFYNYQNPMLPFIKNDKIGDFDDLHFDVEVIINNPRHKNALSFYEEFTTTGKWGIEPISHLFQMVLGNHWGLIKERDPLFDYISYLGIARAPTLNSNGTNNVS